MKVIEVNGLRKTFKVKVWFILNLRVVIESVKGIRNDTFFST